MCKVSVIVPIYNVEKYIEKCITSIIKQDLLDIEIILINDGSTDNSYKIAKTFAKADKRVKLINQKNKGLSGARNSGLKIATGEYISFIDSDDWIEKTYLSKMYTYAKKNECDVIMCNYTMVDDKNNFQYKYPFKNKFLYSRKEIINDIASKTISGDIKTTVWDKLYRRKFLEENLLIFDENIVRFEDWHFWINVCTQMNKFMYINESLYNYRIINESLSHKYYEDFFEMIITMNKRKILFMKELKIDNNWNLLKMRSNFIDDIIKSINHVIYESNKSIKYKFYKIKKILNNSFNDELLNGNYISDYLGNTQLNKYYAKIILHCINKKRAILIYLFIKGYKSIKR